MMPMILVTLMFRAIVAFKVFDEVYLLTGGGPGTATQVVSFSIYRRFFTQDRAGYGSGCQSVRPPAPLVTLTWARARPGYLAPCAS